MLVIIRDGYTNKDTQLCLKVGTGKGEWEYERDFLRDIAHTEAGRYFPRIVDAFPWRGNDGVQKYVIVMDFLEGFRTLEDFVASYGSDGVPPGLAQSVLSEIINVLVLLHQETVTYQRRRRTRTRARCHADFHECNIMVKLEAGRVQVMVIDPHKESLMKPHNSWTDMFFVAKHAVMLSCCDTKPKAAMKEARINELPTGVRQYIFEALGESNFEGAVKFGDISDKNGMFWDRKKRSKKVKPAAQMLEYVNRNRVY